MKLLNQKNAIITGARRGIGRATVEVFAKQGANIWACARKCDDAFEADMRLVAEKYGVEIWPVYFDATNEAQIKEAIQHIRKQRKQIDILANIAGTVGDKMSFPMSSIANMRELMEINFFSSTLLTQYVVRLMARQNYGSIIFVSSIAGLDGMPSQYGYAASKSAMIGAVKNLAREVAQNNVRVNAVAPGMIDTDMGAEIEENLRDEMLSKVVMKRVGRPEEVANVIAFLGSDLSSYMTAQVIRVDGGV